MSPLTEQLRQATTEEARAVRGTALARRLARGALDRGGYARLLSSLQALYAELEWALLWNRRHPGVGPLCLPELWCNELLQDDLRSLLGPGWHASARRQDVAAYVERLGLLCDTTPALLAAHAWVLYATELPGAGQSGAGMSRTLGLRGASGTSYLRHATHLDGTAYRAHLLDTLDQMVLGERERDALVHEARHAVKGLFGLYELLGRGLPSTREERALAASVWGRLMPLRGAFGA
ncbi:heme oxygenase (biliverdin-producing) [Archangium primigenium]|uniref:biliverdin-producing heme oxygenase n=1 Tax=[Archangium] primigenium TaxID=2792470 RepID=UPI00195A3F1E|nr:biliverdin-producing heme oxygenase [Archangium primigenium]MBM7118359.1 biliverdin-producing heme oxygenase [Archangium primigenium]